MITPLSDAVIGSEEACESCVRVPSATVVATQVFPIVVAAGAPGVAIAPATSAAAKQVMSFLGKGIDPPYP